MTTYFTADLHLGTRQEYGTIEEHDAIIIDNINRLVARNDRLIILGDFKHPAKYRCSINCHRVFFALGTYARLPGILVKLAQGEVWCSHSPYCYCPVDNYGGYHAYGNAYQSRELATTGPRRSMDVGVDNAKFLFGSRRPISEGEFFATCQT